MNNKTNTTQGTNVEYLFKNSIPLHPSCLNAIKSVCGIPDTAGLKSIDVVGGNKRKTDVEGHFGSEYPLLRVTIKSFTVGYNHLERRGLATFCRRNQIRKADENFLEKIILRKAWAGKGSTQDFVLPSEKPRVEKIFEKIEVGTSALLGNDHPQILAVYSVPHSLWHLYDINKQILPLVRQCKIGFTVRSSNIELGEYIVIQRKGSAKGEYGSNVNLIGHTSNDLQIKIRIKKLFNDVRPLAWYKL